MCLHVGACMYVRTYLHKLVHVVSMRIIGSKLSIANTTATANTTRHTHTQTHTNTRHTNAVESSKTRPCLRSVGHERFIMQKCECMSSYSNVVWWRMYCVLLTTLTHMRYTLNNPTKLHILKEEVRKNLSIHTQRIEEPERCVWVFSDLGWFWATFFGARHSNEDCFYRNDCLCLQTSPY